MTGAKRRRMTLSRTRGTSKMKKRASARRARAKTPLNRYSGAVERQSRSREGVSLPTGDLSRRRDRYGPASRPSDLRLLDDSGCGVLFDDLSPSARSWNRISSDQLAERTGGLLAVSSRTALIDALVYGPRFQSGSIARREATSSKRKTPGFPGVSWSG